MHELISRQWNGSHDELSVLGLPEPMIHYYLNESKEMLQLWLLDFLRQLSAQKGTMSEAFRALTPDTEVHMISQSLGVQGYADAILRKDGRVKILDYKTSNKDALTDSYRLQLGIYALLYKEIHGTPPDLVGIHFLKFCEKCIPVDDSLLCDAERECCLIHEKTKSDRIEDYPKKESRLCRWSSGECDFYKNCK